MSNNDSKKLSPSMTWLIALGSVGAGVGISYAASGLGQKATAAIYFAIVAAGGFASMYLTRARLRSAVGAFLLTGAIAGIAYFFLVNRMMAQATELMTDAVSGGQAHAQGVAAGSLFGKTFGIFAGAIIFLETIVAGIGGAFAGSKARGQGGLAAIGSLARSAS